MRCSCVGKSMHVFSTHTRFTLHLSFRPEISRDTGPNTVFLGSVSIYFSRGIRIWLQVYNARFAARATSENVQHRHHGQSGTANTVVQEHKEHASLCAATHGSAESCPIVHAMGSGPWSHVHMEKCVACIPPGPALTSPILTKLIHRKPCILVH